MTDPSGLILQTTWIFLLLRESGMYFLAVMNFQIIFKVAGIGVALAPSGKSTPLS